MRLPATGRISQGFSSYHPAIDVAGAFRSPIVAPHSGRIAYVGQMGYGVEDCGQTIDISGGRFFSRMCHNDQIIVSLGQYVTEGQQIGYMGYTGYTIPDNQISSTHCHWVLFDNGVRVDGRNYLTSGGDMEERIKQLEASEQRLAAEVVARDNRIAALESRIKTLEASEQRLANEVVIRDKKIQELQNNTPGDYELISEPVYRKRQTAIISS